MLNVRTIPIADAMAPNGDIVVVRSPASVVVYFACYDNEADLEISEYIGKLTADRAVAMRMYGFEGARVNIVERYDDSYIYEVIDSEWLAEVDAEALRRYPRTAQVHKKHIIVEGHSSYVEIICDNISVERASPEETAAWWRQMV